MNIDPSAIKVSPHNPVLNKIKELSKSEKNPTKLIVDYIYKSNEFSQTEKKKLTNFVKQLDSKNTDFQLLSRFPSRYKTGSSALPAPGTEKEMIKNLNEIINKYPQYILGNNLEVYSKNDLPMETDPAKVYQNLKIEKSKILNQIRSLVDQLKTKDNEQDSVIIPDDKTNKALTISLAVLVEIDAALEIYKPRETIPITFMIENSINKDSPDVFLDATKRMLNSKSPVVLTKAIVYNQTNEYEELLKSQDVYVQRNGGFILVLPKGENPSKLGFNTNEIEKWTKPLSEIPVTSLDFSKDVDGLLLKDQEDLQFDRIISLQGHGSSPHSETILEEGQVSGLPISEFQKGISTLKDKNMIFLHIFSCHAGGVNTTQLHTSEGTVPCPILVESSVDIPAYASSSSAGYDKMFTKAEKLLFKKSQMDKRMPKSLQHASQADMFKLAHLTPLHQTQNPANYLNSLSMTILPSNVSDVPRVSYSMPTLGLVFDVNKNVKNMRHHGLSTSFIEVPPNQSTLLFSAPVIDSKIIASGTNLILIARGGNSQHLVRELEAPNVDLMTIVKSTFEMSLRYPSPARKAYFFGSITCKYNGVITTFKNCMIKKSGNEAILLFKKQGEENFTSIGYVIESDFYDDTMVYSPKNSTKQLTSSEANLLIYDTLRETEASDLTLKQAGTTPFPKNILAEFNELFWQGNEQDPSENMTNKLDLNNKIDDFKKKVITFTKNLTREEMIKRLKQFPMMIKYADEKWQNDVSLLLELIPLDPTVLQFANSKTLLEILKQLPAEKYLKYVSEEAKEDEEVVIAFLKHNTFNIDDCTNKNKSNPRIMLAAIAKSDFMFPVAAASLKNNEDFLLKCIEIKPTTFKHMSEEARSNPLLVSAAISQDEKLKKYVGISVKDNLSEVS